MSNTEYTNEPIHEWFELSYAQYLTIPRSVLQSMPQEWQDRFVKCLEELKEKSVEDKIVDMDNTFTVLSVFSRIPKAKLIEHLENCLKQPITSIGNVDYQKGYRQSISDFIDMIKLRWNNWS